MTTFTPPVAEGPAPVGGRRHPLWRHYGNYDCGITVWRGQDGQYRQSMFPYHGGAQYRTFDDGQLIADATDDVNQSLASATEVYIGGSTYDITSQQETDLTAAGYGNRINLAPVNGLWVPEQLSKFDSKMLLSSNPPAATGPPFVSENRNLKIQLTAGPSPATSGLREWFLHSDTKGWVDSHGIVRVDPPLYQADVDGDPALDIFPQMGVVLRAQFNSSTGKNQGITLNNGTIFGLPILNIGAWHAFPDGTGFANRQFSWPLFESLGLPYGWEWYLNGNIIRARIFPAGDDPNVTPWDHPTHARTLNLDVDCGSTAVVPTPSGAGTAGIIAAHLGTDVRSAARIRGGFFMERL